MRQVDTVFLGAAQVVTLRGGRKGARRGTDAMNRLDVIEDGALAVHRGKLVDLGTSNEISRAYRGRRRVFLRDRTVLPGFCDAHTHPVFAAWREGEYAMRCRGADYLDILKAGGGIHASAEKLRGVPQKQLAESVRDRLDRFLLHGTTCVEGKSGYGLSFESEIKSLKALRAASRGHPVEVARTFLGAHAIPPKYARRRSEYIDEIVERMIPAVESQGLAEFCDVFVERGAFRIDEAETVLRAGRRAGLRPKVHADQFRDSGGARLAARVKAISVEHVDATGPRGIKALADAGVVAVLLPSASVFTGMQHAPNARKLIDAGVAVALATDFNPGTAPMENLGLVASLGTTLLGMTPEEAIVAITRNGAAAMGRSETHGILAPGRNADFVILDAPSYIHLPYRQGTNLVHSVYVKGQRVVHRRRLTPR